MIYCQENGIVYKLSQDFNYFGGLASVLRVHWENVRGEITEFGNRSNVFRITEVHDLAICKGILHGMFVWFMSIIQRTHCSSTLWCKNTDQCAPLLRSNLLLQERQQRDHCRTGGSSKYSYLAVLWHEGRYLLLQSTNHRPWSFLYIWNICGIYIWLCKPLVR